MTDTGLVCADPIHHALGAHDPRCYPNSGWWANHAVNEVTTPAICAVEPIRGPSENAVTILLPLLEKAKNGEILSIAVAWEEGHTAGGDFAKEPGGSFLVLTAELGLLTDDVKAEIRNRRKEDE